MKLSKDLTSARWIHLKGWLFLLLALLAGGGLLMQMFSWQNLLLLVIAMWAIARWYYYLFYVIERYVDSEFRFAGVFDAVRWLLGRKWD